MAEKEAPPLIWVKWEDATMKEDGTWFSHNGTTKHEYVPAIMMTVGFLLHEDPQGIIVTHTWNEDCMAPRDQIPRGMIIDMGPLTAGKKNKVAKCK